MRRDWMATLGFVLLAGTAAADEIALIPGSTIKTPGNLLRGPITSETPTEVKITSATGPQSVPIDQIASVTYDGVPATFNLAESNANKGQLDQAAEQFKKAATEAAGKPLIAQEAMARRIEILSDSAMASPSKGNEAIAEIDDFLKRYPTSRHLGPLLETLVKLQLQAGNTAKAEAALATLSDKVPASSDRAAVLKSRVLARSGKADQAISGLDKIILMNKTPVQLREAKLVKAETLVGLNRFDDALALVKEVIKDAPPEAVDVQAVAHNTLGDCYTAAHRPKDALQAYLHTDILYDKDKEQHPRALAHIEQLFRDLKQDGRAEEIRERLRKEYPQSPWSKGVKNSK